ncbi:MAG TPA: Gfo/Idh/MocA family oxidoreductase [Terriglobales bacterium]|nr:Gfo/Idh/MocA family oxidoreductase [Terriglobales bacterium]
MKNIRVGVAGCGAFGRNHVRVLASLKDAGAELTGIYDRDGERARAVALEFSTRAFGSAAELAAASEAAIVAVPTQAHTDVAVEFMRAGCDVMVEKPIAPSLADADCMIAAAREHGRILMVGHLERFNPCVRLIRPRITKPLFFEVHRLSIFTPRSLDVDVLLDLMIHDLDIVLSFVKAGVSDLQAVGVAVLTAHADIANVRLSFDNGCVANLTASRVSTEKVRKLRFFQPGEYISLDYARRDARIFSVAKQPGAMPAIAHDHLAGSPNEEPLRTEIEAFLDAVRSRTVPEVSGEVGRAALAVALRAAEAMAAHARLVGLH